MEQTPRERRRLKTRQAILDAARDLTASNGPDGWTMRELADRIDFTTTATYRYFDSKDAVLEALVDDAFVQLRVDLRSGAERSPDGTPIDAVLGVALAYLEHARANPTTFRLALIDLPSRRSSLDQPPAPQSGYTVLLEAVEEAIDSDELAADAEFGPEQITFTIWSTIHGMAVLEATHLQAFATEIQTSAERGIRRLLAGLSSD